MIKTIDSFGFKSINGFGMEKQEHSESRRFDFWQAFRKEENSIKLWLELLTWYYQVGISS